MVLVHLHVRVRVCACVRLHLCVCVYKCRNVRHQNSPVAERKKIMMPGPMKSGIFSVWYQTEIMNADAGAGLLCTDAQQW
jgi:hypothetical protein